MDSRANAVLTAGASAQMPPPTQIALRPAMFSSPPGVGLAARIRHRRRAESLLMERASLFKILPCSTDAMIILRA